MGKKKLIILGCIIGVLLLGGLIAKPILKGVLKGTAGDIIAPEMTQVDPDSLTPADFGNIVGEQFVTAYKNWLKEGWQTETDTSIRYTFETDCVPIWRELASQEMTESNCFEVLASQYLLGVGYFYKYNISQAAVEAKNALALAKKFTEWNKGDTETVSLAEKLVADIEGGKIASIKGLITALKSAGAMYSLPKEDQDAFFSGLYEEPGEEAASGIWNFGKVAKINDGSIWDEEIARLQGIVAGDYDYEQQAQAQFKIAKLLKMRMSSGHTSLNEVVSALDKVINNYSQSEYATQALKEKADLLATHSTIAHMQEAIATYKLYLQKVNPYSAEAENILKSIEAVEREIQKRQGKIVQGIALPKLVETEAARAIVEARKETYIKKLDEKTFETFLAEVRGLPTTVARIEKINGLLVGDLPGKYKAKLEYEKAGIYEKNKEMKKAVFCLLSLIEEYPSTPTYILANENVKRLCSEKTVRDLIGTYEEASKGVKMILQQQQLNPDKYLFELALSLEAGKDYVGAIKNYEKICKQFPNSEYFGKSKDNLLKVYGTIGRPDKGVAFLKSLEGTK